MIMITLLIVIALLAILLLPTGEDDNADLLADYLSHEYRGKYRRDEGIMALRW